MKTATPGLDLYSRVMLTVTATILLHIMPVGVWECRKVLAFPEEPRSMSFQGDSKELKQTQIVPTLDTPITKGKNVIWCASFLVAWKKLQNDVVDEPVWLKGADSACERLNSAHDPASDLQDESFYAVAGWVSK